MQLEGEVNAVSVQQVHVHAHHIPNSVLLIAVSTVPASELNATTEHRTGYILSPQLAMELAQKLVDAMRELYDSSVDTRPLH